MTLNTNQDDLSNGLYVWQVDNLQEATASLGSRWLEVDDGLVLQSTCICTDTRQLQAGDIFLALVGDNFDGHDYVSLAVKQGAVAVIVEREVVFDGQVVPQLRVSNTRLALGQLGAYRRQQHKNLTVIALTGSSGKTTCKEMLGCILQNIAPTLITKGNLNNDLGVPMMLLQLSSHHRFAVLELGANHVDEIAYTTKLVQPDVACVLNVGTAHLGEFGGRDRICQAKAEIFSGLSDEKVAVLPYDDDFFIQLLQEASQYSQRIMTFGDGQCDDKRHEVLREIAKKEAVATGAVWAENVQLSAMGSQFQLVMDCLKTAQDKQQDPQQNLKPDIQAVSLSFAGKHNVQNALAVTACALAVGVQPKDIVKGLEQARPTKGRLSIFSYGRHRLIDDTYNANPHAVRAGVQVLKAQQGKTMIVLGDIAELGEMAKTEHDALGRYIAQAGVDMLCCVGDFAQTTVAGANAVGGIQAQAFVDKEDLLKVIIKTLALAKDDVWNVLFKGSRTMRMETLIHALTEE